MSESLNLKPVKSEKTIKIKVSDLPKELIGKIYLRNGGNPYLRNENNHIFDGDGMIHMIEFKKKGIIYQNRWIETYRFKLEKKYKKPLFVRLGNLTSISIFTNFMKRIFLLDDTNQTIETLFNKNGEGTANTNIIYHARKLLALNEMDKPYLLEIKNEEDMNEIRTIKRYDFDGKLIHNMGAHPKIDPDTQEMISTGYDIIQKKCYVSFISKEGDIIETIKIGLKSPRLIHDIGITKNKVLILDLPLEFSIMNVIMSEFPIGVNSDGKSSIIILDRNTKKIETIEIEDTEIIFHIANSWETDDGKYIIMYVFSYDIDTFNIKELETQRPQLKRLIIDTKTKKAKVKNVSENYGELPIVEDYLVGKRTNYLYYSKISDNGFDGIVKHDTKTKKETIRKFPEGMYGGESAIHDNYIINVLYNIKDNKSKLAIYNKSTLELIKLIDLGCRVPFGFHGKIIKLE